MEKINYMTINILGKIYIKIMVNLGEEGKTLLHFNNKFHPDISKLLLSWLDKIGCAYSSISMGYHNGNNFILS